MRGMMLLRGRVCIGVQILLDRLLLIEIVVRVVVANAARSTVVLAAIIERHGIFVHFV